MNFIINREQLLLPLQQIVNVIEKRQTMAVLSNILVELSNRQLTLIGSDLEIQIKVVLAIDSEDIVKKTIPARKLLDICKLLPPEANLQFASAEGKVIIKSSGSRFSLSTMDAETYPTFPDSEPDYQIMLPASQLKNALGKTVFCMASLDFRYYLNGLMMNISNSTLKFVASDGHRMALFQDEINQSTGIDSKIIIPRKAVLELSRLLDLTDNDVNVFVSKNNIKVIAGNLIFSAKLIDSKYPNFQQVFQQEFYEAIPVKKQILRDALTRVAILANEKSKGVTLDISLNQILLTSFNPEHEEAEEKVVIEYSGEPISISFNGQYLIDALSNLESEIAFLRLSKNLSCCFVEESSPASYRFIVMPMSL